MEADISILRKTGHFYFALTYEARTVSLQSENVRTVQRQCRGTWFVRELKTYKQLLFRNLCVMKQFVHFAAPTISR